MKVYYPQHTCVFSHTHLFYRHLKQKKKKKIKCLEALNTCGICTKAVWMDNMSWRVLPSGRLPPLGGNIHYHMGLYCSKKEKKKKSWCKVFMQCCFVFLFYSNTDNFYLYPALLVGKLFPVDSGSMLVIATWILYPPVSCITVWSLPFWWNLFCVSSRHLLITSSSEQELQCLLPLPSGRAWCMAKLALKRPHCSA